MYKILVDSCGDFPDWMKHKCIRGLRVSGEITSEERDKLLRWYPSTWLVVNGIRYEWEDGMLNIYAGADIGSSLDGIDAIGTLYIANKEMKNGSYTGKTLDVTISESATKNVGRIILRQKPSRKCLKALKEQFPNTEIEWDEDDD